MSKCLGLSLANPHFRRAIKPTRPRSHGTVAKACGSMTQVMASMYQSASSVFTPVYELHQFKDFMSTQVDPVVDSLLGPG
ncbi:hypothetical protein MGG_15567, partial [Pyricularia oryzae 70-15]